MTNRILSPSGSGAYVGTGLPGALAAFGRWRGRPAGFAVDFLSAQSWTLLDSPTGKLARWRAARTPLVIAVPMLTDDPSTTMQAGARGAYDGHFRTLARTLVAYGYGSASLRVGWEMNGNWYRWSACRDPRTWVAYYRRIVTAMRSVPGQSFRFDWNLNLGFSISPASFYPGNAYVDYVGVDAYDWRKADHTITPAARWSWIANQLHGLNWIASFAAAHGKPVTVPEWALAPRSALRGGGGGDDPYYVTAMLKWIRTHHVAYASYFDRGIHAISAGAYPSAAAAYVAAMHS